MLSGRHVERSHRTSPGRPTNPESNVGSPLPSGDGRIGTRHANGRLVATSELSASGRRILVGSLESDSRLVIGQHPADRIVRVASLEERHVANAVAATKAAPQATTTSARHIRRPAHTAEAKKMAIGASSTTSHRHGNCRNRILGSAFQTNSDDGKLQKQDNDRNDAPEESTSGDRRAECAATNSRPGRPVRRRPW